MGELEIEGIYPLSYLKLLTGKRVTTAFASIESWGSGTRQSSHPTIESGPLATSTTNPTPKSNVAEALVSFDFFVSDPGRRRSRIAVPTLSISSAVPPGIARTNQSVPASELRGFRLCDSWDGR